VCVYFGLVVLPPVFSLILTFFSKETWHPRQLTKGERKLLADLRKKQKFQGGKKKRHDDQYKPRPFSFLFTTHPSLIKLIFFSSFLSFFFFPLRIVGGHPTAAAKKDDDPLLPLSS
jgi:hypothetical protein